MSLISGPQEDRDATEPLLTTQPSSNLIVDFYTQRNTFLPYGGYGDNQDTQPSRTIYSPQHPSQDLIEMLNRNQQLSQIREERKHRDKWCEKHHHKIKLDKTPSSLPADHNNLLSDTAAGIDTGLETSINTDDSCNGATSETDRLSKDKTDSEQINSENVYSQDQSQSVDQTHILPSKERNMATELTLNVENLLT